MKGKGSRRFRILVWLGLETAAARALAHGVLRYTATHRHIDLHIWNQHHPRGEFTDWDDWRPDGIAAGDAGIAKPIPASVRAAAVFNWSGGDAPLPAARVSVMCDDGAIGRLAAAHLLRRNLRHFGCVGALDAADWSMKREMAFAKAVRDAGCQMAAPFRVDGGASLSREREALAEWLRALQKPCGIFAVSDWRAWHVLDICRECGIEVPAVAQVIGVDNEEYICEQTTPTLSSIEPDFETGGYEAMRALDAMLSGRRTPAEPIIYGVRGIVERQSTRDDRGTARLVNLALDFIRLHAASGGTAAEAVKAAGCSPCLLQRYFKKTLGRTIVQEIQRVRLEKARRLLRHSETPIEDIAPLCGYDDTAFLKVLFRRTYGMSMRDYRRISGSNPATTSRSNSRYVDAPAPEPPAMFLKRTAER